MSESDQTEKSNDSDLSKMWLCFQRNGSESILRGNSAGLAYFARQLFCLAQGGKAGSHLHFDEGSPLDEGDKLVVVFDDAPWDKPANNPMKADGPAG